MPYFDERIYNFSAGPAMMPERVLAEARADIWNFEGEGAGIMEISHRGGAFDEVIAQAEADCRTLAGLDDSWAVLFMPGGATMQFALIPMNFLPDGRHADFIDTGVWTRKAITEAKAVGSVHLAWDGKTGGYDHIPSPAELAPSADPVYTHYCSNNTIYGTQWAAPPELASPLVCDASSDIFSRPYDFDRHAIVFGGAQKNLGPAGSSLVLIRRDWLDRVARTLPAMLKYSEHAAAGSRFNTPPTFAIYLMGRTFRWILDEGGLVAMGERNVRKAALIYDALDAAAEFYRGVARRDCRSAMNITFRTPSEELDARFVAEALEGGMAGLAGHRSAGGMRASVYNAFPEDGCAELASFIEDFAQRFG